MHVVGAFLEWAAMACVDADGLGIFLVDGPVAVYDQFYMLSIKRPAVPLKAGKLAEKGNTLDAGRDLEIFVDGPDELVLFIEPALYHFLVNHPRGSIEFWK